MNNFDDDEKPDYGFWTKPSSVEGFVGLNVGGGGVSSTTSSGFPSIPTTTSTMPTTTTTNTLMDSSGNTSTSDVTGDQDQEEEDPQLISLETGQPPELKEKDQFDTKKVNFQKFGWTFLHYVLMMLMAFWVSTNTTYFFNRADGADIKSEYHIDYTKETEPKLWDIVKFIKMVIYDTANINADYIMPNVFKFVNERMNESIFFLLAMLFFVTFGTTGLLTTMFIVGAVFAFFYTLYHAYYNLLGWNLVSIGYLYFLGIFGYFIVLFGAARFTLDWIRILFLSIIELPESEDFGLGAQKNNSIQRILKAKFADFFKGIYDNKLIISFIMFIIFAGLAAMKTVNRMIGKGIIYGGSILMVLFLGYVGKTVLFKGGEKNNDQGMIGEGVSSMTGGRRYMKRAS